MHLLQLRHPKHEVVEEQSLDEKFPSVVTDAVGDILRKESSVPNQEGTTICSLIIRKTPSVKSVSRQKHEPGLE